MLKLLEPVTMPKKNQARHSLKQRDSVPDQVQKIKKI